MPRVGLGRKHQSSTGFTTLVDYTESSRMMRYWSNGQWFDSAEQSIPVMDRGWLHGLGLFETLLAIDGKSAFVAIAVCVSADGLVF
jgi:hypothetical protein